MRLITLTAFAFLLLALASPASGMWGQTFSSGVTVMPDGSVVVAGPAGFNESDEVAAVVHTTVTQGTAVVEGTSALVVRENPVNCTRGDLSCTQTWVVNPATVVRGKLVVGRKASAVQTATVWHEDGSVETYRWGDAAMVVAGG